MENTLEERRLEFLKETVNFYSEDVTRRAATPSGGCRYRFLGKDNIMRKCAIGRHIPDELYREEMDIGGGNFIFEDILRTLPVNIYELGGSFLGDVQQLHDICNHWNEDGLSDNGLIRMKSIKNFYCE